MCKYFEKDGAGITEGAKIVEGFCDFYCRVGPDLAARLGRQREGECLEYMGTRATEELFWRPTSPLEVEEVCRGLDASKAAGWDGVSPRVVKAVSRELAGPLACLYNCCMREGHYPQCFKTARVIPVFKGGDPTQFSNYRPVSVLPVLSQIFERLLKLRLVQFLNRQGTIISGQYGFRAGHSTAMAILDMVERIRQAWAEGNAAVGVFIDLKKAFDTVDHRILLKKLDHYGIRGKTLELLESYLGNRSQYVCYGGFESPRGRVECGVPQGSVLGPLFFILYVNDIARACPGLQLVLFADDTSGFAKDRDPARLLDKVSEGMGQLSTWFRKNRLTLNIKKTEYIFFGGAHEHPSLERGLTIGGELVKRSSGVRFLGVWVDEGLKWTGQIDRVRRKVSQLLGVIGRAGTVLGGGQLLTLYNSMVLPHLQYCLVVWGDFQEGRNIVVAEGLLRLQKRFMGLIAGKRGRFHADPLFLEYGVLKIGDLYRQQLRVHAWQFWQGRLPQGQAAMLGRVEATHGHNTRAARTGLYLSAREHRSVGYRVPKEWATLTEGLRGMGSSAGFKKRSKRDLLSRYSDFACEEQGCRICRGQTEGLEGAMSRRSGDLAGM